MTVNTGNTDVYTFDEALERLTELGLSMAASFVALGTSITEGWYTVDHPDGIGALQVDFDPDVREGRYFAILDNMA